MDRDRVRVRRAGRADLAALVASSHELIVEDAGGHDPWSNQGWADAHGLETFAARINDPDRFILVVDDQGVIVGHLAGRVEDPSGLRTIRTATIGSLYVDPAHRGRGWGGRLVVRFLAWADEVGAPHATVTAFADNAAALRFYRAHGFAPLETVLRRTTPE